jgi:hypothetical protein
VKEQSNKAQGKITKHEEITRHKVKQQGMTKQQGTKQNNRVCLSSKA